MKAKAKAKPFVAIASASPEIVEQRHSNTSPGDPIFNYLIWDGVAPSLDCMLKRVNSAGYHRERNRRLAMGFAMADASAFGQETGRKCQVQWQALVSS